MPTWFLALLLFWLPVAHAQDPVEPPEIEDPRLLEALAEQAMISGDQDAAQASFEAMLDHQEITAYLKIRPDLREALVLERLGAFEESAALYRSEMVASVGTTLQVLRIQSIHPEREVLVAEAWAHVDQLVATAEAGGDAQIYTTSKGAPRYLEVLSSDQALERLIETGRLRYVYVADLDLNQLPADVRETQKLVLQRSVIGNLRAQDVHFEQLVVLGIVNGDVQLGKQWTGAKNTSRAIQPCTFGKLSMVHSVVRGETNLSAIQVQDGTAGFAMAVLEGPVDLKGALFEQWADFRFVSFGSGADFKDARLMGPAHFGGSRYQADTRFENLFAARFLYFNSARFEAKVSFTRNEWLKGATFEDSRFRGPASFSTTHINGRLNLSRANFEDTLDVNEVEALGLEALGARFRGETSFVDARFKEKVRFSLDEVTRTRHLDDVDPLLHLYRDYQGDEDADEPLVSTRSYGVRHVDDLIAKVEADISFANTVFDGYAVFERVEFGEPDRSNMAQFFNTQFLGESHFERSTWHAVADFTSIFGNELSFNGATFNNTLLLDDANVAGRLSLTDAQFADDATWSWYGAQILAFEVSDEQVNHPGGGHRLFYEQCARDTETPWREDLRIARMRQGRADLTDTQLREACYAYTVDEFVGLKDSFSSRAMVTEADNAFWWMRHHHTVAKLRYGTPPQKIGAAVGLVLFETCFGWGVRLGNLFLTILGVSLTFALIYRFGCPNTVIIYSGKRVPIREISFVGLYFVSLQSLMAIQKGWDFAEDKDRFRYLYAAETVIGFIIMTFFVGAYTRMILA